MARTIEEFCGQGNGYSRSITLRNKLYKKDFVS